MTFRVVVRLKGMKDEWILRQAAAIQARHFREALERAAKQRDRWRDDQDDYNNRTRYVPATPWWQPYQQVQPPVRCTKCGRSLLGSLGVYCTTPACPTGLGGARGAS